MKRWISVLLLAAGIGPASAAPGPNVGQLLQAAGRVEIQRAGGKPLRGAFQTSLKTGDLVRVLAGHAEVVLFQNGARFALASGSAARVEPATLERRAGPAPRRLPGLSLDFVRGAALPSSPVAPKLREILGFVVRGDRPADEGPRQPNPNGAVRATPVTLRWAGPVTGDSLHLEISDGETTVFQTEPDLPPTARAFPVPAGVLQPGRDYVWSVTAVHGARNGVSCGGLVRVLTAGEKARIERLEAEARAAAAAAPADPDPLRLLAQAYERLRLSDDARQAYQAVLQRDPGDAGATAALKRLAAGPR